MEAYLRLTKGNQRGEVVRLRMWQGDLVADILRTDAFGARVYWTYLVLLPRKNSKSLIGAGLALDGMLDEPGAEVYSCAADKDQAKLIFKEVRQSIEMSPDLDASQGGIFKIYRDAIEYPAAGSVYKALSAEAFTKEGLNPSRVLFDELHAQPNWELWNVMNQGSDTRDQPLVVAISTFGVMTDSTGQTSVCKAQHEYFEKILSGEQNDPRYGGRVYATKLTDASAYLDENFWFGSNPALGDFLQIEKMSAVSRKMPAPDFKTKRLNIWVTSSNPWLPDGAWDACGTSPGPIEDGAPVVLAFDGSRSNDATALLAVSIEERPRLQVVGLWEKPDDDATWRVPRAEVKETVRRACAQWSVKEIAWDEFLWQDAAEDLLEEKIPVEYFPQTPERMRPATQRFYERVIDREIRHPKDPRLTRHIGNAVLKTTYRGSQIAKDKPDSPRKIDLAVCAVMGVDRAEWWYSNGPKRGPRIW
ncbi:MAG: terminase large subunit [Cellulomonas sp.]|uniref:terminase large subunit domain-containing protein n=1 Tax=Cellulomonas sp. TaxID=40001 RepID=UPI002584FD79|nr:terminase large subunit [Cellulomonas sp.]MCR6703143.1 terminase large subunit [Cellulomonas sp.]